MKKLSINGSKVIIKYIIRVVISSVGAVALLSFIAAQILYKFDLSTEKSDIISLIIFVISCVVVSFISTAGFKNNGLITGLISQIPLVCFSLFNLVFCGNDFILFLIKVIIACVLGGFIGYLRVKKSNKFKY